MQGVRNAQRFDLVFRFALALTFALGFVFVLGFAVDFALALIFAFVVGLATALGFGFAFTFVFAATFLFSLALGFVPALLRGARVVFAGTGPKSSTLATLGRPVQTSAFAIVRGLTGVSSLNVILKIFISVFLQGYRSCAILNNAHVTVATVTRSAAISTGTATAKATVSSGAK